MIANAAYAACRGAGALAGKATVKGAMHVGAGIFDACVGQVAEAAKGGCFGLARFMGACAAEARHGYETQRQLREQEKAR